LTGRPPTPATTPTGLRDLNPAVSPQTEALIIKAMDRDMARRPQTMLDFEQGMRDCLGIPFVPPAPWQPAEAAPVAPVGQAAPPITVQPSTPPPVIVTTAPADPPVIISTPANGVEHRPPTQPSSPPPVVTPATPTVRPTVDVAFGPRCPACGRVNKVGARFCGACGTALGARPPARFQVVGPRGVLWERPILETENPFVIGRRSISRNIYPHLHLTYSDPSAYISRRHAQVIANEQGYNVEDLGSENGTFLNDVRLAPHRRTPLRNGDVVQIGKIQLQFVQG
jgi:hypothetical protein